MENIDSYKTIVKNGEGEFKDRGSRFVGYIRHIDSIDDFDVMLAEIKSLHLKARHHCYAYQLLDKNIFRSNDDGEPSGTAGKPIFNQLLSHELVNVCCIVVRYFGGTKLGTSGLINAYKEVTKQAILNSNILVKYKTVDCQIHFDYSHMGSLLEKLKKLEINITEKRLDAQPSVIISEQESKMNQTINKIKAQLLNRSIQDIEEDTKIPGIGFELL